MYDLIQNSNFFSILDYLFFKAIPFVFLYRIKEIQFQKEEIIIIVLGIIGAFLFDIRALIYSGFVYYLAYVRNKIYEKQKVSIILICVFQFLFWWGEISRL